MKTPTSTISKPARPEAGFTLVELLAVLTILAFVIAAFSLNGRSSLDTAKVRALMVHAMASIQQARADALRGMKQEVFYVDLRNRRLSYPGTGQILELPQDLTVKATVAQSEQYSDGSVGIRFYPAGGSSGGVLNFDYRGQSYEIRVNWLTGNATLQRI